jgi:8-oxo-dGTP pyrophosphatase MutT (NUDIX family)
MWSVDAIRAALARNVPAGTRFHAGPNHAAVAMVLAGDESDLQICFIRRVERPGDPWSGHMAFPGGRACPEDASAQAVAERETREEVGLILRESHRVGTLSELPVRLGGVETSMVLSPFVYHMGLEAPAFEPNEEVTEAYWAPLADLWEAKNATQLTRAAIAYPAIRFHEHLIWGLTLRVLTLFSDVLGAPLPLQIPVL